MTWHAKEMPNDAPELAGSLVGTILGVEPVNPQPTPSDLPARSSEQPPLCAAMVDVYWDTDHVYTESLMADVLDVVRDWLVPEEPELVFRGILAPPGYEAWKIKQDLRARLTEQALIARSKK